MLIINGKTQSGKDTFFKALDKAAKRKGKDIRSCDIGIVVKKIAAVINGKSEEDWRIYNNQSVKSASIGGLCGMSNRDLIDNLYYALRPICNEIIVHGFLRQYRSILERKTEDITVIPDIRQDGDVLLLQQKIAKTIIVRVERPEIVDSKAAARHIQKGGYLMRQTSSGWQWSDTYYEIDQNLKPIQWFKPYNDRYKDFDMSMDYRLPKMLIRTSSERFDVIVVNDGNEDKLRQKAFTLMDYILNNPYDEVKNKTVLI
jgi:hypothetical protein